MRLVLHIGTHKTGSTAIQHYCHQHREMLQKHGVLWPSEAPPVHPYQHFWIADCIRRGDLSSPQAYLARAYHEALNVGAHTLLLSSEEFSTLTPSQLQQLVKILPAIDCRVIVYLRNLYDFTFSILSEWTKQNFLLSRLHIWPRPLGSLNFDARLQRWEDAFGDKAVEVRSYEQHKQDLVGSFLQSLGVDPAATTPASTAQHSNTSPDLTTLLLLQLIDQLPDIADYPKWEANYSKHFPHRVPRSAALIELAEVIIANAHTECRHPKLMPLRDELLRKPDVSISPEQQADYLRQLRGLIDDMIDDLDTQPTPSQ